MSQEYRNLLLAHIAGMALVMEQDEPLDPRASLRPIMMRDFKCEPFNEFTK